MQSAHQDQSGNYGSDLAVLVLASPVEFSPAVQPVCIDWGLKAIDNDLSEGNLGTASCVMKCGLPGRIVSIESLTTSAEILNIM
jgi:hypothetical protein